MMTSTRDVIVQDKKDDINYKYNCPTQASSVLDAGVPVLEEAEVGTLLIVQSNCFLKGWWFVRGYPEYLSKCQVTHMYIYERTNRKRGQPWKKAQEYSCQYHNLTAQCTL